MIPVVALASPAGLAARDAAETAKLFSEKLGSPPQASASETPSMRLYKALVSEP